MSDTKANRIEAAALEYLAAVDQGRGLRRMVAKDRLRAALDTPADGAAATGAGESPWWLSLEDGLSRLSQDDREKVISVVSDAQGHNRGATGAGDSGEPWALAPGSARDVTEIYTPTPEPVPADDGCVGFLITARGEPDGGRVAEHCPRCHRVRGEWHAPECPVRIAADRTAAIAEARAAGRGEALREVRDTLAGALDNAEADSNTDDIAAVRFRNTLNWALALLPDD